MIRWCNDVAQMYFISFISLMVWFSLKVQYLKFVKGNFDAKDCVRKVKIPSIINVKKNC